jgi:hypothetical protein
MDKARIIFEDEESGMTATRTVSLKELTELRKAIDCAVDRIAAA